MIRRARAVGGIGVHVITRPRGGDFLYSPDEIAVMEADIDAAIDAGAHGIVFGMLNPDGTIDVELTRRLVERSRPLPVTFHRAFDMTPDAAAARSRLIDPASSGY
jgi:copper homeostasis protein